MSSSRKQRPPRHYAEGTAVPVGQTKHEIEQLLERHGASQFISGFDSKSGMGFVGWTLAGRMFRRQLRRRESDRKNANPEQRSKEQWRALLLVVKAKLEIIASGEATAEAEFLADLVLPDGSTVVEALAPQIEHAYASGQMPKLLGFGGPAATALPEGKRK